MKTKVLLDIDGVLANFYAGFAEYLNETLGAGLDIKSEPNAYSLHKWDHALSAEQVDKEVPKWIVSGGYKNMPIYPGAKEFVYKLMDEYDVFVVTARVGDFEMEQLGVFPNKIIELIKTDTVNWFKQHGIPSDKLTFDHKKVDFCKNNSIPILIEDKLSTVVEGAQSGIQSILINRNWNQDNVEGREHPSAHTATDYNHILDILKNVT